MATRRSSKTESKTEPVKTHQCCEALKKENIALKSELEKLKEQHTQLIQETSHENFSERRVNLLKSHILQLERQVTMLSDALQGQAKLLDDLQHYGESLANKLKDINDSSSLAADVLTLKKLNKRLKQVPSSIDGYSLPVLYTGRFYKSLTILDSLANKDHYKLREMASLLKFVAMSWLESQLFTLYQMLRSLMTTLRIYPKEDLNISTLQRLDPVYSILLHTNGEIDTVMNQLSLVTQEILTLTLTIPGQIPTCKVERRRDSVHDTSTALKEELSHIKPRGRELLESVLRTLDTIDRRQREQLCVQDKEILKLREILKGNVNYLEQVFSSINSSYKEFLSSIHERVSSPLKDLMAHFYHLQRQHGKDMLCSLEGPFHRLHTVLDEMKELLEEDTQQTSETLSSRKLLKSIYDNSHVRKEKS